MGILINNVGISYPGALYFHEVETYAPGLTQDMVREADECFPTLGPHRNRNRRRAT